MNNCVTRYKRYPWQIDFPPVILNSASGEAAKHRCYVEVKQGNLGAALILVSDLVCQTTITKIATIIQDRKPLFVPVHAEEAISINRIPLAYAIILATQFDSSVELNIVQAAKVNRTGSNGFARLAFPPPFAGIPSNSDIKSAVILDDALTQGGTLANLCGYIAQFGIKTLLATTLTGKSYSSTLAITDETLTLLREKYHELEEWWCNEFGYEFDCLTESEAKYIINSKKDANTIRDRILAERQTGVILQNE
ncbi:hypothetical protein [Beggiatoa leptomitoformis]|uniref:Recombinase n=1 Tax=Beggiatoa leptomitoformis TaxID=288004 RepID=A0A2N9YF38_9GAMM|nr:hypothetical protein [Beggiatoa leptomitoformis]ALG68563.1 recombinase [Beggiatoa leptomitoformis]AUI69092.1 recombinase [Beggiatoa leptomitoformis]